MQKVKVDQIPSDPDQLFIQLYCERKGENNEKTVEEARKSWKSLSSSKKKLFYKTIADRNLLSHAHSLSKTEIYLKTKVPKQCDKNSHQNPGHSVDNQHITTSSVNEIHLSEEESQLTDESTFVSDKITQCLQNSELTDNKTINGTMLRVCTETEDTAIRSPTREPTPTNQLVETDDQFETQSNASSYQRSTVPLIEPSPPTVKLGKELYEVIKGPGQPEWMELTPKERAHYNYAVRTIKRQYVINYMNYLESLSQQQLFDHYMKTLH